MPDEAGSGGPPATLEVGGEVEPTAGGPGVLEPLGEPARVEEKVLTTKQLAWRRFRRHKLAIVSAIILVLITLMVVLVNAISRYNFHELGNVLDSLKGPSGKHWFGTDNLGRDEFVRVMYGGRISLLVGVAVAASAGTVGAVVGGLWTRASESLWQLFKGDLLRSAAGPVFPPGRGSLCGMKRTAAPAR